MIEWACWEINKRQHCATERFAWGMLRLLHSLWHPATCFQSSIHTLQNQDWKTLTLMGLLADQSSPQGAIACYWQVIKCCLRFDSWLWLAAKLFAQEAKNLASKVHNCIRSHGKHLQFQHSAVCLGISALTCKTLPQVVFFLTFGLRK